MAINNGAESAGRRRITARLSAEKRESLQLAAHPSGSTLNQFIVQSALRAAEHVIEQAEIVRAIRLTVEESKGLHALLDEPPRLNKALQRAMTRFRNNKNGTDRSAR